MQSFPPTIVVRHKKENLKKCSLRGLELHPDFIFLTYPKDSLPPLDGYLLLAVDAPPLTLEDNLRGLLVLDGTWRYAEKMTNYVYSHVRLEKRSLPFGFKTAYPRRQEDCSNPDQGLASIEAIYLAYHLLGRTTIGLLDHYHWKEHFLQINQSSLLLTNQ
jgi:pre-rRNA-processing protein TSR3